MSRKQTHKQLVEINKTIQDLKMEIEAIKKTQTEEFWKWKIQVNKQELQMQASPTEYKRWKRDLSLEDTIVEINLSVKENVKVKISNYKTSKKPGTL